MVERARLLQRLIGVDLDCVFVRAFYALEKLARDNVRFDQPLSLIAQPTNKTVYCDQATSSDKRPGHALMITPEIVEQFFLKTVQWVTEMEKAILESGHRLSPEQRKDAVAIGVRQPEDVRIIALDNIPLPSDPGLSQLVPAPEPFIDLQSVGRCGICHLTMKDAKRTLKQKAVHEVREYLIISLYLFVVFSLFVLYKSAILSQHHIDFALHGFALINALALAKVILVAQELQLADHFRDAPLIYPTLLKSFVFTIVLACFKIAEEAIIGRFRGESFHESISDLAGGSWKGILTLTVLLFVVLIPFFGFTELRRTFGEDRLVGAFFRSRHLVNPPPTGS